MKRRLRRALAFVIWTAWGWIEPRWFELEVALLGYGSRVGYARWRIESRVERTAFPYGWRR